MLKDCCVKFHGKINYKPVYDICVLGGTDTNPWKEIGNAGELEITNEVEELKTFNYQTGKGSDCVLKTLKNTKLKLEILCSKKDTLAITLGAESYTIPASVTAVNQVFVFTIAEEIVKLNGFPVGGLVTITGSVQGTDYLVDGDQLKLTPASNIVPSSKTLTYQTRAYDSVELFKNVSNRIRMWITGTNQATGDAMSITLNNVTVAISSSVTYLKENEFTKFMIEGDIAQDRCLKDTDGEYSFGKIIGV
jgi:hypothetical protein